jgi:hypothetical protein
MPIGGEFLCGFVSPARATGTGTVSTSEGASVTIRLVR